jgi:hypothetical protein
MPGALLGMSDKTMRKHRIRSTPRKSPVKGILDSPGVWGNQYVGHTICLSYLRGFCLGRALHARVRKA